MCERIDKRKNIFKSVQLVVIVALVLAGPLPRATPAQAQEELANTGPGEPLSVDRARQVAQGRLETQVALGYNPEWDGATLGEPMVLYDLSGQVSAYLFPVRQEEESAGYLTVAAIDVPNPVIEFSPTAESPLWARRSMAEGLARAEGMTICIDHPLYLGPLSYGYELAPAGGCGDVSNAPIRRVVDLFGGIIIQVDATQAQMPLAQWVQNAPPLEPAELSVPLAYKRINGVPDYCQFQTGGCWSGCAPTASANVLGYWDAHGYPNLQSGGNWQQLVLNLGGRMDTDCGSTNIGNISSGMISYARAKGYYFESELHWPNPSYSLFRSEIDANRPLVVDLIGAVEYWGANHSVTGIGYQTDGAYMIVNNALACGVSHSHYVHYGSGWYSSIGMHPTSPDQKPPTKASNVRPAGWTGPYTDDPTPRFRWNPANDSGSGIAGYYVAVGDWTPDGNDWWAGNVTAFTVPNALSDGKHNFAVTSKDKAGNVNPSNTNQKGDAPYYTFYVDTTAPANPTTIDSGCGAQDGVWQRGCTDPAFTWSGADDHGGSGVQDYHVYWGTDPNGSPDVWRSAAGYDPGPIDPSGGAITYYLRLSTRDNLGHESDPKTVFTLRYDGSRPNANPIINGGVETVNSVNVRVEPNGQDTGSGSARVHLSNDGQSWQAQDYAPVLGWSLLPQNRTWHTVQVELEDGVGNRSRRYTCRVCLDLYPAHPSSPSYRLWSAGSTVAGGRLTSVNYRLDQTVGQSNAGEQLVSANYRLRGGFQAMWPANPDEAMFTPFHCGYSIYLPFVVRND